MVLNLWASSIQPPAQCPLLWAAERASSGLSIECGNTSIPEPAVKALRIGARATVEPAELAKSAQMVEAYEARQQQIAERWASELLDDGKEPDCDPETGWHLGWAWK